MQSAHKITFKNEELWLLPQRAVYWPKQKALLLADLHLGKASHFRIEGIPVPEGILQDDLNKLESLIDHYAAKRVYLLGDLFHSRLNPEWDVFVAWMHGLPKTQFHLIRGNHDILPEHLYEFAPFKSVADELEIGPFLLVHDADTAIPGDMYPIAGHVHPACRISGGHNQSLRLPCFYFGEEYALIPAFGRFTGTAVIKTHKGDHVFAIVEDKVLQLPT